MNGLEDIEYFNYDRGASYYVKCVNSRRQELPRLW